MFSLVKFENGEHSVLPSKRVNLIQDKDCIVKVKSGAKYQAYLVDVADAEQNLILLRDQLEKEIITKTSGDDSHEKKSSVSIEKRSRIHQPSHQPLSNINTNTNCPVAKVIEVAKKPIRILKDELLTKKIHLCRAEDPKFRRNENIQECSKGENDETLNEKSYPLEDQKENISFTCAIRGEQNPSNQNISPSANDNLLTEVENTSQPPLIQSEKNNEGSLCIADNDEHYHVMKMTSSTPPNATNLSNVILNFSNETFILDTPESSVPSGFIDIRKNMEDSLLDEQNPSNQVMSSTANDNLLDEMENTSQPSLIESEKDNEGSLCIANNDDHHHVKKMIFSTPINATNPSNVTLNLSKETFVIDTPESSAPSGFTNILENMDGSWLKSTDKSISYSRELSSNQHGSSTAFSKIDERKLQNDNTEISSQDDSEKNINESENGNHGDSDPDYYPEESTTNKTDECSKNSTNNISAKELSSLFDDSSTLDVRTIEVPVSKNDLKRTIKKHFCLYCHTLQSKFARHLTLKHKNEEDVKKFIHIPKGLPERKSIIDAIRKKGNFLHNTKAEYNTGILIPSRLRQEKFDNIAEDYICCTNCKAFFSKKTIRIHFSKCDQTHKKGVRNITVAGRRLTGYIHNKAERVLRRVVFPVLRDDEVTRSIKYDELVILFGNRLCDKYTLDHQHDMIRAQLRLLGRFKLAMKAVDPEVNDFDSILRPQRFDSAIDALRTVAHWNATIMWFETPAVAQNLVTLIKKIANKSRTECIKVQDHERKKNVEDFLLLWTEEVPILINKKALEDQITQKRQKKLVLPSKEDIKLLFNYLKKEAAICCELLQDKFDLAAWKLLNQCTLILIQIFNRRRAGEIERLKLVDYENKEKLDENINKDLCRNLSPETMRYAKQYVRLTLRGKLSRTVSVLLSPFIVEYIEILLKYRKEAVISSRNEYVFAVPNTNSLKKHYIRACPLMRRFSNDCGALIPSSLRGTELRKHIATYTAMLDIEENQVDRLANFMGHHKEIHKSIYRVPVPITEMTDVSRLLVAAMGDDEAERDDEPSEDENSASSDSDCDERFESGDDENNGPIAVDNSRSQNKSTIKDKPRASKRTFAKIKTEGSHSGVISSSSREHSHNTSGEIRRRSTSPYGKTPRRKWSEPERKAVTSHFGELKTLKKLPSLIQCSAAIQKYKALRNRQPQQLKSFIDNQRRVQQRREAYYEQKSYE